MITASLVETVRVDGKPRQRHIAYLASIPEDCCKAEANAYRGGWYWHTVDQRVYFWARLEHELIELGFTESDLSLTFKKLGRRIQRPKRTLVETYYPNYQKNQPCLFCI